MFAILVKRAVDSLCPPQVEHGANKPPAKVSADEEASAADPSNFKAPMSASGAGANEENDGKSGEHTYGSKRGVEGGFAAAAAETASSKSVEEAKQVLRHFCLERIDDLKDKAAASTFFEPAYWYLQATGQSTINFEVHAVNVYLTFLAVVLGVRTSR